ncbi:MAG: LysM peptidoglycan-binding domain-containing protein, partial [Bdellovibrionales bacterium]|nr:LysM peptidoglycan-binding domain-containing protein [Bdellovibrionales bacterium]
IALVLTTFISTSISVYAQDEASELEELEKELDALESDGGDVVTDAPDFTEQEAPAETLENAESGNDNPSEEVIENADSESIESDTLPEDVIDNNEEDIATVPEDQGTESLTDESDKVEDAFTPIEPEDSTTEEAPEQFADDPITIPGAESESPSEEASTPSQTEELPTATNEVPEMLSPVDEPNLKKERSIFNAYQYIKNYSNLDETWQQASAGREAESYGVQAGDSLWDISLTLFGNPYFWPKIWQINSGITNPHEIKPGDPLVFIEGDLQSAPQLSQGEAPMEGEDVTDELPPEEELLAEIPELPAVEEQRPPLAEIPPSLAAWHLTKKQDDDLNADKITKIASQVPNLIRLSSYVVEDIPAEAGKIVEIEMGSDTANLYQNVFIESDQIGVGDTLVSYAIKDKIHDKKGEIIGYAIELHGTLKVTEAASTDKSVFKAIVTYLASPIRKGTFIKKGAYPIKTLNKQPSVVSIDTEIIGAEFDDRRRVLGTGSIVYLANGSDAGIQEGTALRIIKNQKVRNKTTLVDNNTNIIGTVQIIDVQPTRSTGVISNASDAITIGDNTGATTVLSYGPTDSTTSDILENEDDTGSGDDLFDLDEEIDSLDE